MNTIKKIIKAIFYKYKYSNYTYEDYARAIGVKIGENCVISSKFWSSEPNLIEIGNHVHITSGVKFLTHDGAVWVFRQEIPDFDVFGKIIVGDNTYIGNNVMVLPGVTIGRNCIVGACSVVTKSIPDNTVVAGNPAKFISDIEQYKDKMVLINMRTKTMKKDLKQNVIQNLPQEKLIKKPWLNIIK
jgi:acetyltransferase-like isoleucine patch superfamily enzyme